MSPACPIAYRQIDATVVRINSLSISLLLIAYLLSPQIMFMYFIGIDLIVRLFINDNLSPINQISRLIKVVIRAKTMNADAAAKRLAAYFALAFAWMVVALHIFELSNTAKIVTVIFVACSLMELLFNYCVGCKIYFLYKKLIG